MKIFKVGDRIRIRKDLSEEDTCSSSFGINDEMETFRGRMTVIRRVLKLENDNPIRKYRYFLDIDHGRWSWGIDMFGSANKALEIE